MFAGLYYSVFSNTEFTVFWELKQLADKISSFTQLKDAINSRVLVDFIRLGGVMVAGGVFHSCKLNSPS